ncbi:HEPN domain-containing protein [Deinococcus sp. NW-56]|uniref:ApeA N-terminal domain 1-containing protein n=1 Tax=Deinococcus sp. NW-56 TaxID=2080419 RepID=UPI000CF3B5BC|nr:HEPN domain-containing protein [Deinococcus sp. NW-56]
MASHTTYHGLWQAPDNTLDSYGYFEIRDDGLRLNMIGIREHAFEVSSHDVGKERGRLRVILPFSDHPNIPTLSAKTAEGKTVSLFDLAFRHSRGEWLGRQRDTAYYEYEPQLALIGERRVDDLSAERFTALSLDLHSFSGWPPGSPFEYEFRDDQPTRHYFVLEYQVPVTSVRVEELHLTLEFRTYFSSAPTGGRHIFDAHGRVTLVPDEPASIHALLELVGRVHILLDLLVGQRLKIKRLGLMTSNIQTVLEDGTEVHEAFELVTSQGRLDDSVDERVTPVFPYEDLGERAPVVFSTWLGAERKLRRAVNAFVVVAFAHDLVLDSQYTDLAGIVESLAREGGKQYYVEKSMFRDVARELRAAIPEDLPETLRSILAARIDTANEHSLQSKATALIEACWPIFADRITLTPFDLAAALANNRHALVHNDEGKKKLLARDGLSLYWLTQAIKWLAYGAIALRLGMDRDTVLARLRERIEETRLKLDYEHFKKGEG